MVTIFPKEFVKPIRDEQRNAKCVKSLYMLKEVVVRATGGVGRPSWSTAACSVYARIRVIYGKLNS